MTDELYTVPVRGFRRFDIGYGKDDDGETWGWLTGCTYKEPWDFGVNEAKCAKKAVWPWLPNPSNLVWNWEREEWVGDPAYVHTLEDCSCGLHAVFDVARAGYKDRPVSGMIEGWGEVVAGPDGFRASKAKIVALCLPPLPKRDHVRFQIDGFWCVVPKEYLPAVLKDRDSSKMPDQVNRAMRTAFGKFDVPIFTSITEMVEAFPPDKGEAPMGPEEPKFKKSAVVAARTKAMNNRAFACIGCGTPYRPGIDYHQCVVTAAE